MSLGFYEILGLINMVGVIMVIIRQINLNRDVANLNNTFISLHKAVVEYVLQHETNNKTNDIMFAKMLDHITLMDGRVINLEQQNDNSN